MPPQSPPVYWTQKASFNRSWDVIVLEASLYTATDGGGVVWAGSLHSQRHPGLCQDISPTPPRRR